MLDKEIIIRRLAIIKHLYTIGVQHSMQVDAVAAFSILAFHDCAEMFLLLVAEDKGDKTENISFMEFWDKYPNLTLKESMRRLKDRRVSIKHKGLFPSKTDIEISRITMTDFLCQNTPIQFGIEFTDVSVSNLISYDNVKEYVDKATMCLADGQLYDCLINSKIAFSELMFTYENSKKKQFWIGSRIAVGEKIGNGYKELIDNTHVRCGNRWFEQVTETINRLRDVLKITALGIDYKKYTFFETITPMIFEWCEEKGRQYQAMPQEDFEERNRIRSEDCEFCIDFVIDCALKLQDFDYDINSVIK